MTRGITDVVVIGAGAVGASIAYELTRAGARVTLVDADDRVGNGCSGSNAGLLTPSHVEPLANPANVMAGLQSLLQPSGPFAMSPRPHLVPWMTHFLAAVRPRQIALRAARLKELATRSLAMHEDYAKVGLATGFERSGVMDVYATRKRFDRVREAMPDVADVHALDPDGARLRVPALGELAGAVLHADEAHCDGRRFVEAVVEAASQQGVDVRLGAAVTRILIEHGRAVGVETDRGRMWADHVVVAGGIGSSRVARSAGCRLPMQAGKGYVLDVTTSAGRPEIPVSFKDQRIVTTPYEDRLRVCGTFELTGDDTSINHRRMTAVLDSARGVLPGLTIEDVVQARAGLRPCSPDGLPYVGRTRAAKNLVLATGHGMWGLTLGPVTGELIARGVVDDAPTLREIALSPDRFRAFT